jgi:hypothetical protein
LLRELLRESSISNSGNYSTHIKLALSNSGNYSLYINVALSKRKRQRDWKEIDIIGEIMMFSLCMYCTRNLQADGGRHKTQSKQSCNPITETAAEHRHCRRTGAAGRTAAADGRTAARTE